MVLYTNVNIGQKVEVLRGGRIHKGTVKYKGCLNGIPGDWVGMELIDNIGKHDGMVNGRRYFKCMPGHGIFTTASKIRFIPMKRRVFNTYRSVKDSATEETLFGPLGRSVDSEDGMNFATEKQRNLDSYYDEVSDTRPYYPRCHAISRTMDSVHERKRKQLELEEEKNKKYPYKEPLPLEYNTRPVEFITSPTIPKTHMPHTAQKRQNKIGWERAHYTRELTVNTARENISRNSWNYM